MIYGNQNVFPLIDPQASEDKRVFYSPHPGGIDLRTWMATQFMAAHIAAGDREGIAQSAINAADMLIAALNKPQEVKP